MISTSINEHVYPSDKWVWPIEIITQGHSIRPQPQIPRSSPNKSSFPFISLRTNLLNHQIYHKSNRRHNCINLQNQELTMLNQSVQLLDVFQKNNFVVD
jgi:hypothetical protein